MIDHFEVVQAVISLITGIFGVGIGVGIFKRDIRQVKKDLAYVIDRQDKLRTSYSGGLPLYMPRITCDEIREDCSADRAKKAEKVIDEITIHTKNIRSLENFARWWMQKEGLTIEQINKILTS